MWSLFAFRWQDETDIQLYTAFVGLKVAGSTAGKLVDPLGWSTSSTTLPYPAPGIRYRDILMDWIGLPTKSSIDGFTKFTKTKTLR